MALLWYGIIMVWRCYGKALLWYGVVMVWHWYGTAVLWHGMALTLLHLLEVDDGEEELLDVPVDGRAHF